MALLPILSYPDPRLHTVAKPVAVVDDRIRALAADMIETMYDSKGVGLAATQVNVHERLVVIDVSEKRKRTTGAGADAQISGTMALYSLERDLRQAGLGFGMAASSAYGSLLGCSVSIHDGNSPTQSFNQRLSPVVITNGTAGAPDTLTVWWGNPARQPAVTAFSASTDTSKLTGSRTGIAMGELLVAAFGSNCHLLEVTSNVNVDGSTINQPSYSTYICPCNCWIIKNTGVFSISCM